MAQSPCTPRVLIYVLRRDVRLSDNPVFHHASLAYSNDSRPKSPRTRDREDLLTSGNDNFTHLLPVYIFPANQVEVSGFLVNGSGRSPYPEARSQVAGIWRTGSHRANFMAEGVWDLKEKLEQLGCGAGLEVRVGMTGEVVQHMLDWYAGNDDDESGKRADVAGIWMTAEESPEEQSEERNVRDIAEKDEVEFKLWKDEKYYIDDDDLPFSKDQMSDLPNVYTSFRKSLEPLRSRPRQTVREPKQLPPLPPMIPPQHGPFEIPTTLTGLKDSLLVPLQDDAILGLTSPPCWPKGVQSAHPLAGGETAAQERLSHLISSGAMTSYKATRNGMLGLDFSTKLSAYLAQGHLTARQLHWAMVDFEEGTGEGNEAEGFGKGENDGTAAVRFELLWRDYMRLCQMKFGRRMFNINGIREHPKSANQNGDNNPPRKHWKYTDKSGGAGDDPAKTREVFERFQSGRTGIGLIDASQRELYLTGYTSNRARQNVASFLATHLGIDWRIGAEWYEFLLIDYDAANNWGNWQYIAGVGNDPRQGRVFNPVKQALDYDKHGEYIRAWVPELRDVQLSSGVESNKSEEIDQHLLMGVFQAWRLNDWEKQRLGLKGLDWVDDPLVRINFSVRRGKGQDGGGRDRGRMKGNWRGRGRTRDFRRMGHEDKANRGQGEEMNGGDA